jgi:gamma-glutamyltranspeptidase/glutathione hydrolase
MHIPDLADFLDLVRRKGSAALTEGGAADALVELMRAGGGLITHADLAAYAPVVRPATSVRLTGGWSLATNPPPAIGGPVLAALLLLLDGAREADRTELAADLVRVTRAVLAHRFDVLDVSADLRGAGDALLDAVRRQGRGWLGSPSTAHVSAVDGAGLACSVTASFGYGSGITLPGTGVWLNNCLGEHELNVTGLHALTPGARLASNMAPTAGRREDGTVLAIGSPGADRITTALGQVITRLCRRSRTGSLDGDALAAAVAAPRLHISRGRDGVETLHHEEDLALDGLDDAVLDGLVRREHHASSMYFGGVAAALRTPDGRLVAAADPRRDGATAVGD